MRYLKIASDENPETDSIELNDFNGFLCTSLQTLGLARKHELLTIHNRQFSVDNKPDFKRYRLVIEILTRYDEYEAKYRELISFFDRNKTAGFRLYYRSYNNEDLKYCLCEIENLEKIEKRQPISITLIQTSLWLGELKYGIPIDEDEDEASEPLNLFAYKQYYPISGYYSANFSVDDEIQGYYALRFENPKMTKLSITNNGYNKIPLIIYLSIHGVNPVISLFKNGDEIPFKRTQILVDFLHWSAPYAIEINSTIENAGVRLVNRNTGEVLADYSELVNNEFGSPYFYIEHGDYIITVTTDIADTPMTMEVQYQEEFYE